MEKSLNALNEQRVEKVNRLKIAERERDNLSGSKAEAEIFIEKEKEVRRKQNILFQIFESACNDKIREFSAEKESVAEKLAIEKTRREDQEKIMKEKEKEYENKKREYENVSDDFNKANLVTF